MTSHRLRIGAQIWPEDPFWVQVLEAIRLRAQQLGADLVRTVIETPEAPSEEDLSSFTEELLAQDLDVLMAWNLSDQCARPLLEAGLPLVYLTETDLRHPRLISPRGLYRISSDIGAYLADRLAGRGEVATVGGWESAQHGRLAGIRDALRRIPGMRLTHIPSLWRYEQAYPQIYEFMQRMPGPPDAIFGFSDSLALAARDAGRALGLVGERTLIVGINGDPLALAAIAEGGMTATMLTSAADLGAQAIDLAIRAAQGQPLPKHFGFRPRLVTAENVAEVAAQQLIAMAALPSRLVGYSRQQEQQRLMQLETSLEINRRAGLILDRQRLSREIADLIRANYGYDEAQIFRWDAGKQALWRDQPDQPGERSVAAQADADPALRAAIERNEPIFIPDLRNSRRFARDPNYPETRSRVVAPIRLGGRIIGLLDLHSYHSTHHNRHELIGLQTLADQLGIAMRNAELYGDAVQARALAEKADTLKTRLLANVSHELRTPLNIILGYSQAALETPNSYGVDLPPQLRSDLQHIYHGGEHLIRLINDLLDLSRAEIDELDLFPETIATRAFLEEVFHSIAGHAGARGQVAWRLDLPGRLPVIQADPVRLRQILLNLLHNARTFTSGGQVTLGAEVMLPHLHIWVADTGRGIPIEQQERIFEPFGITHEAGRREGIGLGLSITRRLVALHCGSMTLESQEGQGSTFHVYLPLLNLSGRPVDFDTASQPALLLIAADGQPDELIAELCRRQGLALRRLRANAEITALLAEVQPVALAWNLAQRGADEWAAFQQIRSQPQLFHLPVILYHQEPDAIAAQNIGLTGVVLKPLSDSKLLDALDRLRPAASAGPILIVDDDPQAHDLYRRLIAEHFPGYPLRSARGGREALSILEQETPSLVILDLIMPEVDGFEVLERLRAAPHTRTVPALVMSGQMLSFEDIQRLDQARVIFHGKGVLTDMEAADMVRRALTQSDALPQHTSILVKHAVAYIHQNHAFALSRQEIADAVGVNKDYLTRIFHRELGISPWDYLNRYRITRAKDLLRTTHASISSIAAQVGFDDPAYFSRVFHRESGCTPGEYRERR